MEFPRKKKPWKACANLDTPVLDILSKVKKIWTVAKHSSQNQICWRAFTEDHTHTDIYS